MRSSFTNLPSCFLAVPVGGSKHCLMVSISKMLFLSFRMGRDSCGTSLRHGQGEKTPQSRYITAFTSFKHPNKHRVTHLSIEVSDLQIALFFIFFQVRLQTQVSKRYAGTINCFTQIVKHETVSSKSLIVREFTLSR